MWVFIFGDEEDIYKMLLEAKKKSLKKNISRLDNLKTKQNNQHICTLKNIKVECFQPN